MVSGALRELWRRDLNRCMKNGYNMEEEQTSDGMMTIQLVDEPLWEIAFISIVFICFVSVFAKPQVVGDIEFALYRTHSLAGREERGF